MTNKEFVQNHVPFSELKKAGFFPKEMKFNDYDAITERFLQMFNGKTKEEYVNLLPVMFTQSEGKFPDKVTSNGEYKSGGGFHLSLVEREYDISCCICECRQLVSISTSTNSGNKKCKGCKRKIAITVSKNEVKVTERL